MTASRLVVDLQAKNALPVCVSVCVRVRVIEGVFVSCSDSAGSKEVVKRGNEM